MKNTVNHAELLSLWNKLKPTISGISNKYAEYIRDGVHSNTALEQEAYSVLLKSIETYDFRQAKFKTYFITCLENRFKNLLRSWIRNKKLISHNLEELPESTDRSDVEGCAFVKEVETQVLGKLRPFDKQVFTCLAGGDYKGSHRFFTLADEFGVSYHKVLRSWHRIKKEVQTTMIVTF